MTKNEIIGRLREAGINASSADRSAAAYVEDAVGIRATAGWFGFRISCDSADTERRVRTVLERYYNVEISGGVWRLQSKRRLSVMAFGGGMPPTPPTPPTPTADYLYFEAAEANSTVSMMSTLVTAPNLEYSTDGETWQEWQHTTADDMHTFDTLTLTAVGDRVYLRGDNPAGLSISDGEEAGFSNFIMSGQINSGGSVTSLIDGDGVSTTILTPGSLMVLFGDMSEGEVPNTALLTAPSLGNVTVIGDMSCFGMFEYCINLESPSNLSKVISIGYNGCFSFYAGCENLTSVSDFTALTTVAEEGLFNFCIACGRLISPADMPALTTTGKSGCENLYYMCTSLQSAADMPSLTDIGYSGFYNMYGDCTFNMSDNGTTLNFDFPTPPITTTGDDPQTFATAYDVASWMGNTNGFTTP